MEIERKCVRVLWVFEPERVQNWGAVDMLLVESCVEVVEEAESELSKSYQEEVIKNKRGGTNLISKPLIAA